MQTPPAAVCSDSSRVVLCVMGNNNRVWFNRWGLTQKVQHLPGSTRRICQLTESLPHINDTTLWDVVGTDMGVPVVHQNRLYFVFGDVKAFNDRDPVAFTDDNSPEPAGIRLNPVLSGGTNPRFKALTIAGWPPLGTIETPTAAFSYLGRLYVFVISGGAQLVSAIDAWQDFDLNYSLGGQFALVAASVIRNGDHQGLPSNTGDGLLVWGWSGWNVHLLWTPLDGNWNPQRATPPAPSLPAWYFAGEGRSWSRVPSDAQRLFSLPSVTHLSVSWREGPQRWLMLYTMVSPDRPYNGVFARAGISPWQWSEEVLIFQPFRDGALTKYMHEPGQDNLYQYPPPLNRDGGHSWAYAPFLIDRYTTWDLRERILTFYFTMSTAIPYQVMLMRSDLKL